MPSSESNSTNSKIDNRSDNSVKSKKRIRANLLSEHIIGVDTVDRDVKEHRFTKMLISKKPESLNRVIGYRCAWSSCDFVAPKIRAIRNHVNERNHFPKFIGTNTKRIKSELNLDHKNSTTKISNGTTMSEIPNQAISLVNGDDIKHQSVKTAKSLRHQLPSQSADSMSSRQTANSSIKSDKKLNPSKSTVLSKSDLVMNERMDLLSNHVIGVDTKDKAMDNRHIRKLISKKPESLKRMIGYRCAECDFADAKLGMVRNHVTTCFRTKIKTSMVDREKLLNDHIIGIDTVDKVMPKRKDRFISVLLSNKPESLNILIGYRCSECDFVASILSHVRNHQQECHKDLCNKTSENFNMGHKNSDNKLTPKMSENKRLNDEIFSHNIITIDTVEKLTNNLLITSFLSNKLESFNKVIGYRCNWTHCNRIELDLDAIYAHIETYHNEFRPKCVDCDTYFDNGVQRENHVRNMHRKHNNESTICKNGIKGLLAKYFTKEVKVKNSDESAINDNQSIVDQITDVDIEEVLMSENRFIARVRSPNDDIIGYVCKWPQCEHFDREQSRIYEHNSTHKKDIMVKCSYCDVLCGSIKKFKKHQNNDDCVMNLNNKIEFNKHIIGVDTYDEITDNSRIAVIHSKKYNLDRNVIGFRCLYPDCDYVDKKRRNVTSHIKDHTL